MGERILVTGGSGFIGTNLLEDLIGKGYAVCNLDVNKPKIPERGEFWRKVDITDRARFEQAVEEFAPDYIVHLAARTDLDGKTLEDYRVNIAGTENLLNMLQKLPDLKKVMFASSKFVARNGYRVKNQRDYCPHTRYGESKAAMEARVWENKPGCDWCVIRPTSIWGPWFGEPYRSFFDLIMRGMYFHIGHIECRKTYGYVGNAVYQIERLLFSETADESSKVFYIGDEPAYEINEWADEIANELGRQAPVMPVWLVKCLAKLGDFLGLFGIRFPMQSFRFWNMTHDGINDLTNTYKIAPETPYTRLQGTKETIAWIREHERE